MSKKTDKYKTTIKRLLFVFVVVIFLGILFYFSAFVKSGLSVNIKMGHITISKVEYNLLQGSIPVTEKLDQTEFYIA
ncbi:MAG: hypothetical protein PVF17_06105 [Ignavibacteria bacterium]|jgi:hypothetical protein